MTAPRVAFLVGHTDNRWIGGTNYITNLIRAILSVPGRPLEPVILLPPGASPAFLEALPEVKRIESDLIVGRSPSRFAAKLSERILGRNLPLEALLKKHGISVLSHSPAPGRASRIPVISWVPDFQHRRLPGFFSEEEVARRDKGARETIERADRVLVSSHDALNDFGRFLPEAVSKARVLHFVSGLGEDNSVSSRAELTARYGLTGPYLHLPNQFWKHKNHSVVIEALSLLKQKGKTATVVSTGHTEDYRHPEYFAALQNKIQQAGISIDTEFKILGVVPYSDLRSLMHHSAGIINPSEFEGWSTTVEEGKSLGKLVILSDIPVHREQNPERAKFFRADDAGALADHIGEALASYSETQENVHMAQATQRLEERYSTFANNYVSLVKDLLAERQK